MVTWKGSVAQPLENRDENICWIQMNSSCAHPLFKRLPLSSSFPFFFFFSFFSFSSFCSHSFSCSHFLFLFFVLILSLFFFLIKDWSQHDNCRSFTFFVKSQDHEQNLLLL